MHSISCITNAENNVAEQAKNEAKSSQTQELVWPFDKGTYRNADGSVVKPEDVRWLFEDRPLHDKLLNEVKTNVGAYFIGLIIGIGVFLYIRPKRKCINPKEMAKIWLAWGLMASIVTGSSQIAAKGAQEGVPAALLGICFFSGAAWLSGYVFGLIKFWLMSKTSIDAKVEEQIYAKAAQEISNNQLNSGVMAKAYSQSNGDENKAKALYIQIRVKQLIQSYHDDVRRGS